MRQNSFNEDNERYGQETDYNNARNYRPPEDEAPLTRAERKKLEKIERQEREKQQEQDRLVQQAALEEEKRANRLQKQEQKEQRRQEKRVSVVPTYKWFFILIFCLIPIVNLFLFIYWGFFSDRVNKNIRNFVLATLILSALTAVFIVAGYFSSEYLDPQLIRAGSSLSSGLYDLFSAFFNQIGRLLGGIL
ncbi:MAG: hypothetical protein WDW20_03230 [Neisseriaceae bacterium]